MTIAGGLSSQSLRIAAALAAIALLLRTRGVAQTVELLWRFAGRRSLPPPADDPAALAAAIARRIAAVADRMPLRPQCLVRTLLLAALLRRYGVAAELRIGVAGPEFSAHAWLEVDGAPIREEPDVGIRYRPIWSRRTRRAASSGDGNDALRIPLD